jgi:uncharacterized protein YbjQ (UPF0145 family)
MSFFQALMRCGLMLALTACTHSGDGGSSAVEQQQLAQVEFIRPYELSRVDVNYTARGEVSGSSCQGLAKPAETRAEALLRLKLAAAEVGANRVILRQCSQVTTPVCAAGWVCTGDAHQLQPLR